MSPKGSKHVTTPAIGQSERISPADLKNKFGEIQGELQSTTESARNSVVNIGIAVGAVIVLSMFAIGMRRGKKRTTIVEIRRV